MICSLTRTQECLYLHLLLWICSLVYKAFGWRREHRCHSCVLASSTLEILLLLLLLYFRSVIKLLCVENVCEYNGGAELGQPGPNHHGRHHAKRDHSTGERADPDPRIRTFDKRIRIRILFFSSVTFKMPKKSVNAYSFLKVRYIFIIFQR